MTIERVSTLEFLKMKNCLEDLNKKEGRILARKINQSH